MNSVTQKEIINYLQLLLRKPKYLGLASKTLFNCKGQLMARLFNRPFLKRQCPSYITEAVKRLKPPSSDHIRSVDEKKLYQSFQFSPIRTASGMIELSDRVPWDMKFDDLEDSDSIHRWTWIIYKLQEQESEEFSDWAETCMMDWIGRYGKTPDLSLKWDAYTVSERICNAIIFYYYTKRNVHLQIEEGLHIMAYHLARHLEYYGPKNNFNHILNNARALFLYGVYFHNDLYKDIAINIFREELPFLISEEGFLREGSSHYHFLVTRWILEVVFFGDERVRNEFHDVVEKMIRQCRFFLVREYGFGKLSMPLIGDVSPDVSPEWLMDLPFSGVAQSFCGTCNGKEVEGWARLFSLRNSSDIVPEGETSPAHKIFIKSGWCRFCCNDIDLFLYLRPKNHRKIAGHFHNDALSFCLFIKGRPVLIDCGRQTYSDNDAGRWGQSARAHNSLVVDDLEPCPFFYVPFLQDFFCEEVLEQSLSWNENEESLDIKICFNGFRRIKNDPVGFERIITIRKDKNQIQMEDRFLGEKKHFISSFFHFDKNVQLREGGAGVFEGMAGVIPIVFEIPNQTGRLVRGEGESVWGWCSLAYGRRDQSISLICDSVQQLPTTMKCILTWR